MGPLPEALQMASFGHRILAKPALQQSKPVQLGRTRSTDVIALEIWNCNLGGIDFKFVWPEGACEVQLLPQWSQRA